MRINALDGKEYGNPCGGHAAVAYLVRYSSLHQIKKGEPRIDIGYETVVGLCRLHKDDSEADFYKPQRGVVGSIHAIPDLLRAEAERDRCDLADHLEMAKSHLVWVMSTKNVSDILESEWREVFEKALSTVLVKKVLSS